MLRGKRIRDFAFGSLCYGRSGEEICTGYMPWPPAGECNMITTTTTTFNAAQLSTFINRIRSTQRNWVHSSIMYVQRSAIEYMPVHAHTYVQSRVFVIFD